MNEEMNKFKVYRKAIEVFEKSNNARRWFSSEIPALSGYKPFDLINYQEGQYQIYNILYKLETGDFS